MQNLLAKGAAHLAQQQAKHAADWVYYTRGTSASRVRAVRGQSTFEVTEPDGMALQIQSEDFIVRVEDLVIDGIQVEPTAGDRIVVQGYATDQVFEMMSIPGQPSWRFTDQHRMAYRIHTKHVDETP